MLKIDHVLLATTGLPHGAQQLWRGYGLRCAPGGSHLRWGTANLIVPIGSQYLELVAVEDTALARNSLLGRAVLAAADRDRLTPVGLCLAAEDLAEVGKRLGQKPQPGSRTLADGTELEWSSVGMELAFGAGRLPFFLNWADPSRHPSRQASAHRAEVREIAELEVGGEAGILRKHLGGDVPGVDAVGGAPGVRSVRLRLEDGSEVQLP
ncbi:MAG: VOC family protein [Candidatus Dormibacteria bacterium]